MKSNGDPESWQELVGVLTIFVAIPIGYFISDDGFVSTIVGLFWAIVIAIGVALILILIISLIIAKQDREIQEERRATQEREHLAQEKKIAKEVSKHIDVLVRKRKQLLRVDDYGSVQDIEWKKEISKFFNSAVKELPGSESHLSGDDVVFLIDNLVKDEQEARNGESDSFDVSMTGLEYEHWVSEQLQELGWITRVTKGSGDQGVDVIAEKEGKTVVIQCKKYSSPVGNKSVQEAHAGKGYIDADAAVVVTNASFTRSAHEIAQSLGVQLLHHENLKLL